jgi:hypothetical protein
LQPDLGLCGREAGFSYEISLDQFQAAYEVSMRKKRLKRAYEISMGKKRLKRAYEISMRKKRLKRAYEISMKKKRLKRAYEIFIEKITTVGVVADTLQQLQTPRVNPMHLSSSWSPYALFKLLRTLEPRLLIKVITNSTL